MRDRSIVTAGKEKKLVIRYGREQRAAYRQLRWLQGRMEGRMVVCGIIHELRAQTRHPSRPPVLALLSRNGWVGQTSHEHSGIISPSVTVL